MLKRRYLSGAEKRKVKKQKEEAVKELSSVADFFKPPGSQLQGNAEDSVDDQLNQEVNEGKSDSLKERNSNVELSNSAGILNYFHQ